MKLIIADTGPVLHLEEAGLSSLLPKLGEVYVTPAVLAELQQRAGWSRPAWLQVAQPSVAALRNARLWVRSGMLHDGEAEALAHAKEVRPDYFLTDDGEARVAAQTAGLHVRGSLGVVLGCAAFGLCTKPEAEQALDALESRSTLWLTSTVKLAARVALQKLFP